MIILLGLMGIFCPTITAENVLSLSSVRGYPGEEVTVDATLDHTDDIAAVQLDIPLDASQMYVDGSARLEAERSGGHGISVSRTAQGLRVLVYSGTMAVLRGHSGRLLSFKLKLGYKPIDEALHPKCILSDTHGKALPCQVHDGHVVAMVPAIRVVTPHVDFGRMIMGGEYRQSVVLRNVGTAVVHLRDVALDATDDAFAIGEIPREIPIGKELELPVWFRPQKIGTYKQRLTMLCDAMEDTVHMVELNAEAYAVNELEMADVAGKSGEEVTVKVSMRNMLPVTAVQFVLALPQGLQLVGNSAVSCREGFTAHAAMRGDSLVVMLYSAQGKEMSGGAGDLLTFRLRITGEYGTYVLVPEHVIMGSTELENVCSGTSGVQVTVRSAKMQVGDTVDLGRLEVEQPCRWALAIHNAGQENLQITDVRLPDKASVLLTSMPMTVAPGQTDSLWVCTTPIDAGRVSIPMDISSNDPASRVTTVMVKAEPFAPNSLLLQGTVSLAENQADVVLLLDNYTPISALQADMLVADGISVDVDNVVPTTLLDGFTVACKQMPDSRCRLMVYSVSGKAIRPSRHEGTVAPQALLTLHMPVKKGASLMGRLLTLENVKLSDQEGRDVCHQPTASYDNSPVPVVWDANKDGVVDITDVVVVNGLLQASEYDARYDYDQDGSITILDVMKLLHAYLQVE